jgi:SAM-dependent methyltransferase
MIDLFVAVWVIMFLLAVAVFIHGFPAMLAVGPIPAHKKGIAKALEMADIKPNEKFYDLGCGDGRVLIEAVKKYNCLGIGYELMMPYFLLAKIRAKFSGNSEKMDLRLKNIFQSDIENADVIFCFLSPSLMQKMSKYLKTKNLKKGARIVSYAFRVNDMKPVKKISQSKENWNIYLYKI